MWNSPVPSIYLEKHNFILFNGWIKLHRVYIYIYIYHSFLIHSSVLEHVGCFQSLGIINSPTILQWTWVCKWLYKNILEHFPSDICLGVVSLDSFLKDFHIAFHSDYSNLHPTNSVEVFLFPTSSPAFVVCVIVSHFDWGKMESQCSFDLHFLYGQGCWTLLHVFIGHLYFFWESFAHLFSELLIL
jgi:hypothetical protein